jgi:hypothetical protein
MCPENRLVLTMNLPKEIEQFANLPLDPKIVE